MNRAHLFVWIAACGVTGPAVAADINVPADFVNIQDAITAAVNGDVVIVAPGVYNQSIDFMGKAITVRSTDVLNPAATTLNGGAAGTVVLFVTNEGPDSVLAGFTIVNGLAASGGGAFVGAGASPRIEHCHFELNQANSGGGLAAEGSPTLYRCQFTGNTANVAGGGLAATGVSSPVLDGCRFEGNDAPTGSGLSLDGGGAIVNTEVFDNVNGMAIALAGTAPVDVAHCTVVGNAAQGLVLAPGATAPTTIANSIVRSNATQIVGPPAFLFARYSNVQGGFAGPGNIDLPAQFVSVAAGDFRLLSTSPCIDAGENASLPAGIIEDLGGVDRVSDRASVPDTGSGTAPIVDMGAHEFPPPRRYVSVGAEGLGHGSSWNNAYADLQDALDDARVAANEITEVWVAAGSYKPDRGTGLRGRTFDMISDVSIIGGFAGGETDASQRDPVANETILSGAIGAAGTADNSYNVVTATNVNDGGKLIGFTIRLGQADNVLGRGAGLNIAGGAPVIRECWVRENYAVGAAGLWCFQSDPTFVRTRFCLNTASGVGGLEFWESNPLLVNCYVAGNLSQGFGAGGIRFHDSTPTMTNCTVIANTSTLGSPGGIETDGAFTLAADNCIIRWNTGASGTTEEQQVRFTGGATGDINYCSIGGWTGALGGVGNDGNNPLFVDGDGLDNIPGTADDDPRLTSTSPCIDAGDADALPAAATVDLDGNDRFVDNPHVADAGVGFVTWVDRGAYEHQRPPCPADVNGDDVVDVTDLLSLLGAWGVCPGCPEDTNGDGAVDVIDLLELLGTWGLCP